jgi:ATP:corrinoid adenosyltransferase
VAVIRHKKEKDLVIAYIGEGVGKTTAALASQGWHTGKGEEPTSLQQSFDQLEYVLEENIDVTYLY